VSIAGDAARVVSAPDARLLQLRANAAASEVHVRAVRKGTLPELPVRS